jgi:hypothetical protein
VYASCWGRLLLQALLITACFVVLRQCRITSFVFAGVFIVMIVPVALMGYKITAPFLVLGAVVLLGGALVHALFAKARGCDLVNLLVSDLVNADQVRERVLVFQRKTKQLVHPELTENTWDSVADRVKSPEMIGCACMFPSRFRDRPHILTRQNGRLVRDWVTAIDLEPSGYGTHSMRRTKAAEIYRKTRNLRAVQLLLGHTKVDSTVRYLSVEHRGCS